MYSRLLPYLSIPPYLYTSKNLLSDTKRNEVAVVAVLVAVVRTAIVEAHEPCAALRIDRILLRRPEPAVRLIACKLSVVRSVCIDCLKL